MKQYKKREEYVTAVKYTGDINDLKDILSESEFNSLAVKQDKSILAEFGTNLIMGVKIKLGDYVVKYDSGHIHRMSPEDFATTYEI